MIFEIPKIILPRTLNHIIQIRSQLQKHNPENSRFDSQNDTGGWASLNSLPSRFDTNQDGMPDKWEKQNGLNPKDPKDRNSDLNKNGYPNLEE